MICPFLTCNCNMFEFFNFYESEILWPCIVLKLKQYYLYIIARMTDSINIILANAYPSGAIGDHGKLPWSLAQDLRYFKRMTTRGRSAIIMGRKTWDSFGRKPLPNRVNIVISRSLTSQETFDDNVSNCSDNAIYAASFKDALEAVPANHTTWVIGGAEIYSAAIKVTQNVTIHQTEIYSDFKEADVFWRIPDDFTMIGATEFQTEIDQKTQQPLLYRQLKWTRELSIADYSQLAVNVNQEENQYLDLITRVMQSSVLTDNRTGVKTKSIFGGHMRFNLSTGFPAITTKSLFWRGVVEELLWILSGDTNARHLADIGVHIWDKDTSRKYLDKRGRQHLAEFEAGATYGHNMRHFGAKYTGAAADYTGLGIDQLAAAIKTLKHDPTDRRIIINLWDPNSLADAALPPCLLMYIFYVADGRLSCMAIQRSADLMLGVPFNIASSSLFTHILANMVGLLPGEVDHNMTNVHIYESHFEAAAEQLLRRPFAKCALEMPKEDDGSVKKLTLADIDAKPRILSARDFRLIGYRHWPKLKNATEMCA